MVKSPKDETAAEFPESEVVQRRDAALKRALMTPREKPKPKKTKRKIGDDA